MTCPNCRGQGGMTAGRETLAGSYWSPPEAVWLRCRTCKGTGRIESGPGEGANSPPGQGLNLTTNLR